MTVTPSLRSLALGASLLVALSGCGSKPAKSASNAPAHPAPPSDPALADATQLGREIFEVVDKVMAYKSAHFSNLPRTLTDVGVDSLTPTTVRRYARSGTEPTITAAFRRAEGHPVLSCAGTNKVLEDSMLNGGTFEVTCQLAAGGSKAFTVGG